jgi:type IV pilus assembly protein PilY1
LKSLRLTIFCLAAWSLSAATHAEDIDLFVGVPAGGNGLPNVLFIVDNTANWNGAFTNEKAALANTLANLPLATDGVSARFNVGIMLATETGSPNNNTSGAYVRAAIRPMNAANKALYAALVNSFDQLADKGNGGYSALNMTEAFRYFSGGAPFAGNGKVKTDYTLNTTGTVASNAIYALPGNALSSMNATTYAPLPGTGCNKNYIIYISNGPNQESNSTDTQANLLLSQAGGSTAQLPLSPTGSQSNPADEWARFMKQHALKITTYTIDVDPPASGQGPGWSRLLNSMAEVSGGEYRAVNSTTGAGAQISDAINKALSEIQAVNSVFSSAALPLAVNNEGTYLNQVYFGMFRPNANAFPMWTGNLKQYKLGFIPTGELRLLDADGESAISGLSGFIKECARSFWTPTTADAYWAFSPQGECIPPIGSAADLYKNSNFPDGNVVEKGGQAYTRRANATRVLKTCDPAFASCTSLTDFNVANSAITGAGLGFPTASTTERNDLVQWSMGLDVADENGNGVTTTEMRASVHGDVVHSRPAAINFGTVASPSVVVFYGGNDGVFRAINGNRTGTVGGVAPGEELWSFVPPEFWGNFKRLRDNTVQISFPNIVSAGALPKPYGIDGPISSYMNGTTSAWVYAPMRRGGRALYSFNVPVGNPENITLKWKIGCPNNFPVSGTCTTGFDGIGQTWSSPKPITATGYGAGALLIMGGGYDPCEDANPSTCTAATTKGNKVYVLNANTGALQKTFTTDRAVVADVAIAPDLSTGAALYAYVVDLGGNVYRIDIGTAAPSSWTMTKIASLGCATTTPCAQSRKFMFAPDLAYEAGIYYLMLGSGDREKPLNYTNPVDNYFFLLQDKPADSTWLSSETSNCSSAILCLNSLTPILTSANPSSAALAAKKGWYLGLAPHEQVVTGALTIYGNIIFNTHEPAAAAPGLCSSNLGIARVYNVNYANAAPESGTDRFGVLPEMTGLAQTPVGGPVLIETAQGTQTVMAVIGGSTESSLQGHEEEDPLGSTPVQPKSRVYWYIQR